MRIYFVIYEKREPFARERSVGSGTLQRDGTVSSEIRPKSEKNRAFGISRVS